MPSPKSIHAPRNLSEKYIGDDNLSIYATSILGEIMIFFPVIKSISLHTQIFSLWKREIRDNGNESVISKSFARVYEIQQTIFSIPSFNRHLQGHSSEIRGLCLMKCSSEMLQNFSHFWNTKTNIVFFRFSFRAT